MRQALIIAILFLVPEAYAGPNVFVTNREAAVARQRETLGGRFDHSNQSVDLLREIEGSLSIRSNEACDAGDPHGCDDLPPGERKLPLAATIPPAMGVISDIYNNKNFADLANNNLNSELVINKVASYLGDSSVAAGESDGAERALLFKMDMALDDMRKMMFANLYPSMAPFIRASFECVQKRKEEGYSDVDAKAICSGDRNNTDSSLRNGEAIAVSSDGFTFLDHPAKENTPDTTGLKINLSERLYNEEGASVAGPMQELRDSFKEFFGDVVFEIKTTSSGTRFASFKQEINVQKPKIRYDNYIVENMNRLTDLVHTYCTYQNAGSGSLYQRSEFEKTFLDIIPQSDLDKLSFPGFVFNAEGWTLVERGVEEFFKRVDSNDDYQWVCTDLPSSFGSLQDLEKFLGEKAKFYQPSGPTITLQEDRSAISLYQDMFMISRGVALGKFLWDALEAEKQLDKLSAGVAEAMRDNLIKEGQKLIYSAAGTSDIAGSLMSVIDRLVIYVRESLAKDDRQRSNAARLASQLSR